MTSKPAAAVGRAASPHSLYVKTSTFWVEVLAPLHQFQAFRKFLSQVLRRLAIKFHSCFCLSVMVTSGISRPSCSAESSRGDLYNSSFCFPLFVKKSLLPPGHLCLLRLEEETLALHPHKGLEGVGSQQDKWV